MRTIICILALVALACGQCGDPSENTACPAGSRNYVKGPIETKPETLNSFHAVEIVTKIVLDK